MYNLNLISEKQEVRLMRITTRREKHGRPAVWKWAMILSVIELAYPIMTLTGIKGVLNILSVICFNNRTNRPWNWYRSSNWFIMFVYYSVVYSCGLGSFTRTIELVVSIISEESNEIRFKDARPRERTNILVYYNRAFISINS